MRPALVARRLLAGVCGLVPARTIAVEVLDAGARLRLVHCRRGAAGWPTRWADAEDAPVPTGRTDVVVPLRSGGRVVGRLHLCLDRFLHPEEEEALLRLAADAAPSLAPVPTPVVRLSPAHRQEVLIP